MQDEVTQADREAAAKAFQCKPLMNGNHDADYRVQAFARHRQQAERDTLARMEWSDIESASKDEVVLLYGKLRPHPDNLHLYSGWDMNCRCVGYWDHIDEDWCPVGSTWEGPWIEPTHWMPLPPAPEAGQ